MLSYLHVSYHLTTVFLINYNLIFQITDDDEHFSVTIDVSQFAPDDLKVSVSDGMVVIEGKHAMIKDQFGEVSIFSFFIV